VAAVRLATLAKQKREIAKVYFPGLHGLRFFAALVVVFGHVELFKQYHGYPNAADHPVVYELGRIAVTFFFVLSGFLITILLLAEKDQTGTVAVRRFYVRRVLRIWPLYFLIVALAFFVLPRIQGLDVPRLSQALPAHFGPTLALFVIFMPQVALSLFPAVPYAEPLWSIGVEEQFYLLWPLLVARTKRLLLVTTGIVVSGIGVKAFAIWYASGLSRADDLQFWNHFIDYFYFTRLECMAIGAIGALLVYERRRGILKFLYSVPVQVTTYALTAAAIFTTRGKPILQYTPHSILFCIIILNVATNPGSLLKLEKPVFTFLGNISYSMYMLHELVIGVVMRLQAGATGTRFEDLGPNVLLYATTVVATIAAAALVYHFYESRFLRLKRRFAVIPSGPEIPLPTQVAAVSA
jgi:peptidoglycan/LPS O-acetylase OafA/YrhL